MLLAGIVLVYLGKPKRWHPPPPSLSSLFFLRHSMRLGRPEEDPHELQVDQVGIGLCRHRQLEAAGRSTDRGDGSHRYTGREVLSLKSARDERVAPFYLRSYFNVLYLQQVPLALPGRSTDYSGAQHAHPHYRARVVEQRDSR